MDTQHPQTDVPKYSAIELQILKGIIDDPKAKARDRLVAIRTLKKHLRCLMDLVESPQTTPKHRRELIEALRSYGRL
jgi:hypothetical protein